MIEIKGRKFCENCFSETAEAVCSVCGYDSGSSADDPTLLAPRTVLLGKYVIGTVIGKGGFGVTYLAFDTASEKKVAIKEYFPYVAARRAVGSAAVTAASEDGRKAFELGAYYKWRIDLRKKISSHCGNGKIALPIHSGDICQDYKR